MTLQVMRNLALEDLRSPEISWFTSLVGDPLTLDSLLRGAWRIIPDPKDAEFIQAPKLQVSNYLRNGLLAGDCDDAATLAVCVLAALNVPCLVRAIRLIGDSEFSHVYAVLFVHDLELSIDPIVPEDQMPIPASVIAETMEVGIWPVN